MHPSQALFPGKQQTVSLPVCDHYAGAEALMRKSIALQQQLGPVFDITLDCEDGASTGNEAAHAALVAKLIASDDNHFQRIGTRIHPYGHVFFASDVALICGAGTSARPAYVMLPKADGLDDVIAALAVINRTSGSEVLPLHVLIETHGALHDVYAIAALPQVQSLSFGIMDFVSAHHGAIADTAMRSPDQFTHPLIVRAKLEIAAACHAHGKVASHNVSTDIKNMHAVAEDALRAANAFAYTRMWSIHPQQITAIVTALTPSAAAIEDATQILQQAQQTAWGPIRYQDRLHDRASYRYYWAILQRAHQSGAALPAQAAQWM